MSIIEIAKQLTDSQSSWIDEKLDVLIKEGVSVKNVDIQMLPNSEVRILVYGLERFRWELNLTTS